MDKDFYTTRFLRVLLALWITYAMYTMARRPFSVARANIELDTGLTPSASSLVDSTFMLTYTLGQFLYGRIKMYFDDKRIIVYGILFSAFACALMATATSLWVFLLAWAINGFAQATGWSTSISILNVWLFQHERGRVLGLWATNMAVGGVIGNILPSFIIGNGLTWRWAFFVEVILLVVVGAGINKFLFQHPRVIGPSFEQECERKVEAIDNLQNCEHQLISSDEVTFSKKLLLNSSVADTKLSKGGAQRSDGDYVDHPDGDGQKHSAVLTSWHIIQNPGLCCIGLSYFLHKLVRYGFLFWLPYFAVRELKFTTERAGYVSSAIDIGGLIGILVSGYCSDILFHGQGQTRVVLLFTAGMALSTFMFGLCFHVFVKDAILCTFAASMVGFFSFAVDALLMGPFLLGFLGRIGMGAHVGVTSAVVGGMGSAGSILQGIIVAALSSNSWSTICYSFALVTVLGGLCLLGPLYTEMRCARLPVLGT